MSFVDYNMLNLIVLRSNTIEGDIVHSVGKTFYKKLTKQFYF